MYAVIETGGKQVKVQPGDIVQIEKLDSSVGEKVLFDKVLFVSNPTDATSGKSSEVILGQPYISNAQVEGEVVAQGRGEKLVIIKMKRRKQYRRTQGHRQEQTQVLITQLNDGAKKIELSATDKKLKMAKFFTNLKPKGEAFTPKTLGSRVRMAKAKAAGTTTKTSPATKTASKAAPKKAAPKAKA
jgi:large subunit ribosomal protein L21